MNEIKIKTVEPKDFYLDLVPLYLDTPNEKLQKTIQEGKRIREKLGKISPDLYTRVCDDLVLYGEIDEQKIVSNFAQ